VSFCGHLMRLYWFLMPALLVALAGSSRAETFTNRPISELSVKDRFKGITIVLQQANTVDLFRRYHGEFDITANDDLNHRIEVGETTYCPNQVYVFANRDLEKSTQLYRWTVNVKNGLVSRPTLLNHADPVWQCIDGSAPVHIAGR